LEQGWEGGRRSRVWEGERGEEGVVVVKSRTPYRQTDRQIEDVTANNEIQQRREHHRHKNVELRIKVGGEDKIPEQRGGH
jgi:hypothetical protein